MAFESIRRVNYASAPSCLTAANLAHDLDRFHLPMSRLHDRLLYGPGVLGGLGLPPRPTVCRWSSPRGGPRRPGPAD